MKFKPKTKEELIDIIKEIVTKQNKISSKLFKKYPYGLKDVDTSLITDMKDLFFYYNKHYKEYEINRQIDWEDPRNDITAWNVSSVTDMTEMFAESLFNQNISNWNISNVTSISFMFEYSSFNQDLSNWIFTLNKDCIMFDINLKSPHKEKFGKISSYEDFIKTHVTKQFINYIFKNGNDIEKFKLLKIIKNNPHFLDSKDYLIYRGI